MTPRRARFGACRTPRVRLGRNRYGEPAMNDTLKITLRFVDGRPVTSRATCRLQATGSSTATQLTFSGGAFTGSLPLPAGDNATARFVVTAQGMEFWETSETFTVTMVGGQPLLLGGGRLTRQSSTGSAATTIALDLDLVVLRLKDVTSILQPRVSDSFEVFDFDGDVLGPFATTT